ncbi:substrate-binding domain-containing protein [Leptolyngbya sp. FACHB-8]|uniref:substrate-binding domain-containing protein n=1 Tax=unclassified Leptolyngbya TaxID=2650499 RepID=UPI001688FCC9|nr:substrate-binding domain-containing protein [Leptolyngbya sp. FACHB-8]MBD1913900.1 substrate-binding domain-containing protein [Leptolyngbya sp. FACHB-8]
MKSRSLIGVFPLLMTLAIAPEPMGFALQREFTIAHATRSTPAPAPFPPPQEVPEGTILEVDGSRSLILLNETLRRQFEEAFPGTTLRMAADGTPDALNRLQQGGVDLVAIGRPLSSQEKAEGLAEVPLRREKIALIVSKDNPFQGQISFDQFARIVWGEITNWEQLGGSDRPVRFIDRPETSDTRQSLRYYDIFAGKVRTGKTAVPVDGDETAGVIEALGKDGIGYALYSQVKDNPDVRIVKMHGVSADSSLYPYSQSQGYVYRKENVSEGAQAFLGWATSDPGKAAVTAARNVTWSQLPAEVLAANAAQSSGGPRTAGTTTANSPQGTGSEPAVTGAASSSDRPAEPSGAFTTTAPRGATTTEPTAPSSNTEGPDAAFPWWIFLIPLLLAGVLLLLRRRHEASAPPPRSRAIASPPPPEALPGATEPAVSFAPKSEPQPLPEVNPSAGNTLNTAEPPLHNNGAALPGAAIAGLAGTAIPRKAPKPVTPSPRRSNPVIPDPWETPSSVAADASAPVAESSAAETGPPVEAGDATADPAESVREQPAAVVPDSVDADPAVEGPPVEAAPSEFMDDAAVLTGAGAIAAAVIATSLASQAGTPRTPGEGSGAPLSEPSEEAGGEEPEVVPAEVVPSIGASTESPLPAPEAEVVTAVADVAGYEENHLPVDGDALDAAEPVPEPLDDAADLTETAALAGAAIAANATEPTPETMVELPSEEEAIAHPSHEELPLVPADESGNPMEEQDANPALATGATAAALAGLAIAAQSSDETETEPSHSVEVAAERQRDEDSSTEADFIPMDEAPEPLEHEDRLHLVPLEADASGIPEPATEYLTVDNRAHSFVLDPLRMQQMQEVAVRYPLDSGHYKIFIESGNFHYQAASGHPGEPWVLLWIYGGRFINQKTRVPVSATWSTLNGYHDSLTLEVLEPTTLAALFIDTYKGDNEGELTLSIEQLSPPETP